MQLLNLSLKFIVLFITFRGEVCKTFLIYIKVPFKSNHLVNEKLQGNQHKVTEQ